jgi:hypothetical protein
MMVAVTGDATTTIISLAAIPLTAALGGWALAHDAELRAARSGQQITASTTKPSRGGG